MSLRTLFVRTFPTVSRPMNFVATRTFVASAQPHKSVSDTVKDAAKTVDRTVSKAAIKGLEGVEKVNEVARDAAEKVGIHTENTVNEFEVGTKEAAAKTQAKGEQLKRDTKEGVRAAADKVKDVGS
jgi:hypothetical protein